METIDTRTIIDTEPIRYAVPPSLCRTVAAAMRLSISLRLGSGLYYAHLKPVHCTRAVLRPNVYR